MNNALVNKSVAYGIVAALVMLGVYFLVVGVVSDLAFATQQFSQFWYYIIMLVAGFGIQVGLFTYLKNAVKAKTASGKMLAVSGTTSTVAMVSCCAHYLANILPILGVTGFVVFVTQFQTELFWLGIISNLAGIIYIADKIRKFRAV